jgi:DNA-binding CsgD family transcriptional regulator
MLLIDTHTQDVAQLERARAHAAVGAALRRAGRPVEARNPLRLAVDLAHRCGATELEDEALAELRAAGARPRRRLTTGAGALTPSERRVAELAAAGRRNREIAESLFVTISTVEFHLRHAYRKLGIASRAQLAETLGTVKPPTPRHAGSLAGLDPALQLRMRLYGGLDLRLI